MNESTPLRNWRLFFKLRIYISDSGASELATRRALLYLFLSLFPLGLAHVGRTEQASVQVSREAYL